MTFAYVVRSQPDGDSPMITASSARPAWAQVLRGVAFFLAGAGILIALGTGWGMAKGAWDRHQERRAYHAHLASEGVREVCTGTVTADCARRAASLAGVEVAYSPGGLLLWVSVGTPKFKAYEDAFLGRLWSAPRLDARKSGVRFDRTVNIDGIEVTLWAMVPGRCGCPPNKTSGAVTSTAFAPRRILTAYATWQHDGQLYELETFLGDDAVTTLRTALPKIRYVSPSH